MMTSYSMYWISCGSWQCDVHRCLLKQIWGKSAQVLQVLFCNQTVSFKSMWTTLVFHHQIKHTNISYTHYILSCTTCCTKLAQWRTPFFPDGLIYTHTYCNTAHIPLSALCLCRGQDNLWEHDVIPGCKSNMTAFPGSDKGSAFCTLLVQWPHTSS